MTTDPALERIADALDRLAPPPAPPPRRIVSRYASDAVWIGRHMTPWLIRRLRGVSSGDGRSAKRPELLPVAGDPPQRG